jgi:hypothetical protein
VFSLLVLKIQLTRIMSVPSPGSCRFASFLLQLSFVEAKTDTSLFIYHSGADTIYLLLYVNDIILTASSPSLLKRTITAL